MMTKKTWNALALGASVLTLVTVSACGGGGSDSGSGGQAAAQKPSAAPSPSSSVIPGAARASPAVNVTGGRLAVRTAPWRRENPSRSP